LAQSLILPEQQQRRSSISSGGVSLVLYRIKRVSEILYACLSDFLA
jgi:hypothetical protein